MVYMGRPNYYYYYYIYVDDYIFNAKMYSIAAKQCYSKIHLHMNIGKNYLVLLLDETFIRFLCTSSIL